MSVSAAICIYNDFDFIKECIDRIYDSVDEIVILDGPYTYCEPILQEFDLFYEGPPEALRPFLSMEKVRYVYKAFENEKSKRMALYEMCSCDIVMLLDSDELVIGVDKGAIAEFQSNDMHVAPARIHNHVRSATLINKDTRKFIFFKRDKITSREHLNYTWLVGVEQEQPNSAVMFDIPLMEIAHLTLMRSPFFNIVKYCFYTRLYFYSRGMTDELTKLFGIPFEEIRSSGLDYLHVKEIFRKSTPALVNFTDSVPLYYDDSLLDQKYDDVVDTTPLEETHEVFLLGRVDSFNYINVPKNLQADDVVYFSVKADNIEKLEAKVLIHNGQECLKLSCELQRSDDDLWEGKFVLPFKTEKLFGTLLHFKASSAHAKQIGRLTKFLIKKHMAIYGNCQTESLRDFLLASQEFRRRFAFETTPGRLAHMMTPENAHDFHASVHRVDYLITQPIGKTFRGNEIFSTDTLLEHVNKDSHVFMMPNLFFTGYAPESYCVTYRKKFMQSPMPIHDVNMIYSFIKHSGNRDKAQQDYFSKLTDESFYKPSALVENVKKNLDELTRREKAAEIAYSGANVRHFSYAAFLSEHCNKALTHYSDAHPTEYVFEKLAAIILDELQIKNDIIPPVLGEKGVVPFYKSVGRQFGFEAANQPIMVNNRQVSFGKFCDLYFDAYDKIEADELMGYISNHVTRAVVTNHKTGTMLMLGILREYCKTFNLKLLDLNTHLSKNNDKIDPNIDFQSYDFIFATHAQHFEQLVRTVPQLRYRAIHLIRNPFEIIMSGVRYHQITDETWCVKKLFVRAADGFCGFKRIAQYNADIDQQLGEYTYREIMNLLSAREKVVFEIRNHASAFGTIPSIARFLAFFRDDANVSTIRLEDIGAPQCVAHVFKFLSLREEFLDAYTAKVGGKEWLGKHITNRDGGSTYLASFDDDLFDLFHREFGATILDEFGYAASSLQPSYMRVEESLAPTTEANVAEVSKESVAKHEKAPGAAWVLFAQAEKLLAEGQLEQAKEFFLQSLQLAPGEAGILGRLGDICVRLGQFGDAVEFYKRIEELPISKPAWLYIGLANAYEALTQKNAAAASLRMALNLGADPGNLETRLAALERV